MPPLFFSIRARLQESAPQFQARGLRVVAKREKLDFVYSTKPPNFIIFLRWWKLLIFKFFLSPNNIRTD